MTELSVAEWGSIIEVKQKGNYFLESTGMMLLEDYEKPNLVTMGEETEKVIKG